MTAHVLLARAEAAGLVLEADGNRLRPRSPSPPPPGLLYDLAGAKADLLNLLTERAAIEAEPALPPTGTFERVHLTESKRKWWRGC